MTDPDPRYAGGCTNWGAYDVPALAGFLDEDHARSWAQVSAWSRAADLTGDHLTVLRQARETITRVWPPSTNQAAAAYLAQLDALMASMDTMKVAAEANAEALSGILTVLSDAKGKVDALYEQWKQQEPSWWVSDALAVNKVMTAGVVTNSTERAMQQRKADLNSQAQKVMRETDDSTYGYLPRLVAVPRRQNPHLNEPMPSAGSPNGSNGRGSRSGGGGSVRRPSIPVARPPAADVGSLLTGSGATGPTTQIGSAPAAATSSPDAVSGTTIPGSAWTHTAVGRVLRSGAVLGAPREDEASGSRATARVSPDEEGLRRAGNASAEEPGTGMWGGGVGSGRTAERRSRRVVPPDTEWPVRRGVPPILEPGPEPVHDPGPGVIGIDR